MVQPRRTITEWETDIGAQVRRARLASRRSQADLAEAANVSVPTVQRLEAGNGSSLASLVAVVRALGRHDWLAALAPEPGVDPIALADARRRHPEPKRIRR